MSTMIPNSEGHKFTTVEGRKELMQKYGKGSWPYSGVNEDGEEVLVSIFTDSIVVKTNQHNGWVRVNYYGADGEPEGETFDGRWRPVVPSPEIQNDKPDKEEPVPTADMSKEEKQ